MPVSRHPALFTDLYQLTMVQAYVREGLAEEAVFDLFVRRLRKRNYLVACGLDAALSYLEELRFHPDELEYLSSLPQFDSDFVNWLADFRFTGDVFAVPEGTVVFANEPIFQVVAPLPEAQFVETMLLNQITYQTNVATKAARVVEAAGGRPVADFGMRRMHGVDAAMDAARASFIGGVATTSNVLAGCIFGLQVTGTMAHSYIQAHASEVDAFRAFSKIYPRTTLLVDTYDTMEAVESIITLYHELRPEERFEAVRLDSGDLVELAKAVRQALDGGGLDQVRIMASSSLDEYQIRDMLSDGAPLDGFGVGTRLGTVSDLPYLDSVYKLSQYAGLPRMKLSTWKVTYPGRKQIFRREDGNEAVGDVLGVFDEALDGEPLLECVMKDGVRTAAGRRALADARVRATESIAALPPRLRSLDAAERPYAVTLSSRLEMLAARLRRKLER